MYTMLGPEISRDPQDLAKALEVIIVHGVYSDHSTYMYYYAHSTCVHHDRSAFFISHNAHVSGKVRGGGLGGLGSEASQVSRALGGPQGLPMVGGTILLLFWVGGRGNFFYPLYFILSFGGSFCLLSEKKNETMIG